MRDKNDITETEVYSKQKHNWRTPTGPVAPGALTCPICNTSAAQFLTFGMANRPNAKCPTCGSLERHRFLWVFLQRRTDFFEDHKQVLHMAPDPALSSVFKTRHGAGYVCIDAFDLQADVLGDLRNLPFKKNSFDRIICSHVLEHIQNDGLAINELVRVLSPGNWAVIMVPFNPERATIEASPQMTPAQRKAAFGHPFHFRSYGYDLVERLEAAGLAAELFTSKTLLNAKQRRHWRINRNYLFFCRKVVGKKQFAQV